MYPKNNVFSNISATVKRAILENTMSEEKTCYYHPDTKTRLGCSSCGRPICTKCIVSAPIGYICPDCAGKNKTQAKINTSKRDYFFTFTNAFVAAVVLGYLWNFLKPFGPFIMWASAYVVGYAVAKIITSLTKFKTTKTLNIITAMITVIAIVYNPILIFLSLSELNIIAILFLFTFAYVGNIMNTISVAIAVWAAVRHLKF